MSTDSKTIGGVTYRRVFNHTTKDTLLELEKHIKYHLVIPENFTSAIIHFNANKGLPKDDDVKLLNNTEYYPLRFISQDASEELWLSCVTAGSTEESTNGTLKALELMGFILTDAQKNTILTRKIAHITYSK